MRILLFIQVELFNTGDVIRVIGDIAKVHDLQESHGGWVDDMALVGDVPIHRNNNYSAMLCFVIDSLSFFLIFFLPCSLLARLVVWLGFSPLAMSELWSTARRGPSTQPASSWRLGRAPLNYQVSSYYNSKALLNIK